MAGKKLKIIYLENGGKPVSYQYLSKSETLRAFKILKTMKQIKGWIPVSQLSSMISSERHSTTRTLNKLVGAVKTEPRTKTRIAIRNRAKNPKAKFKGQEFIKPTTYICAHQGGQ